jgi:hypothetical protein
VSRGAAALLLAAALACGVKGLPRPPETNGPNAAPAGEVAPAAPAPDAPKGEAGSCR